MEHTITAENVRDIFDYDPLSGVFKWKVRPRSRTMIGDQAGTADPKGYVAVVYKRKRYYCHRLAWLWMTGDWPPEEIDHRNRQRGDNRFANLRCATSAQNKQNMARAGQPGVRFFQGRHVARICADGREIHLGRFRELHDAIAARVAAETRLHTFAAG